MINIWVRGHWKICSNNKDKKEKVWVRGHYIHREEDFPDFEY